MLLQFILYVMASVIFTEALTELFIKSQLFVGIRYRLTGRFEGGTISKLVSCGYCFSVWAALLPSVLIPVIFKLSYPNVIVLPFVLWIVIHRLSNYLHNINDNYFDKYYRIKD